jgi:hypothetical protein
MAALQRYSAIVSRRLLFSRPLLARCSSGHHDATLEPPMHNLPLASRPLHEQDELIWNDGVAPETALDFDAPHISKTTGLLMWLGGFGFFYGIWLLASATGHPANKPSVRSCLNRRFVNNTSLLKVVLL